MVINVKKAYLQNTLSIINKNKISYIAIMMFVFLSMHMYLLIGYMINDLHLSADNCFNNYKKYDVAVYIANGIDDSLKEDILGIDGTNKIETLHISYGYLEINNLKLDTEVRSLTTNMALPIDVKGRLPVNSNEIALLNHFAKVYNIKIGDEIVVKDNLYLQEEKFIVTALFESSQFLRKMESTYGISKTTGNIISCELFVNKNAFNTNYIDDNYILLKNNSLDNLSKFSNEYNNSCKKYIDKIDDSLDLLVNGNYYIEKWDEAVGYIIIDTFTHTSKTIHKTLVPVLFLVAVVVLIISISRMIIEKRNEIGIMKATGFTDKEIAMMFYIYSLSATIIGVILANIVATFLTERLAIMFTSTIVTLKIGSFMYDIKEILFTIFVPIIIIIITTHFCIKKTLDKDAIDILSEKKTTTTKIFFYEYLTLFKRMPIFIQMIINNMIKDMRRCAGIILGIVGSVMLLASGIVIDRNVYDGYDYQMKNDFIFDTMIYFKSVNNAKEEIEQVLKDHRINYALCQYSNLVLKDPNNKSDLFELFVYDNKDDFSKLFKFNTMNKQNHKYNGLFLQESYKNHFNLDEHGYVRLKDLNGNYKYIRTTQYFYNYVEATTFAAIDKETYENIMDIDSYMQTYIIDSRISDINKVYDELSDIDGYLYHMDYKKHTNEAFMSSYSFINIVVGIFILTSIVFSFLIVLNLMKVNIIERKYELITLLINGFTRKEIKNYVLADMILMIVIGNIIGMVLGLLVGAYVLENFNNELLFYMNKININAICISLIISIVICIIITKLSMKEIELLDINDR